MLGPTGRASGPGCGGATCRRSVPGNAPDGIGCAAATTGTRTSVSAAKRRQMPGAMPTSSPTRTPFHRDAARLACRAGDWNSRQALASVSGIGLRIQCNGCSIFARDSGANRLWYTSGTSLVGPESNANDFSGSAPAGPPVIGPGGFRGTIESRSKPFMSAPDDPERPRGLRWAETREAPCSSSITRPAPARSPRRSRSKRQARPTRPCGSASRTKTRRSPST